MSCKTIKRFAEKLHNIPRRLCRDLFILKDAAYFAEAKHIFKNICFTLFYSSANVLKYSII